MKKKILTFFLAFIFILIGFSFWMSPRLGGLLNFGKTSINKEIERLEFDTLATKSFGLDYNSDSKVEQYRELRTLYKLDSLVNDCHPGFEKVIKIQSWVQGRWEHNGDNIPEKNDALFILKEAEKGKKFRCVEYSIVASQCLASLGFIVRGLGLMTKEINNIQSGGGHVVNEVYLPDLKKWVFIDPQYDVITISNGIPLNAVELQNCIANQINFDILNPNHTISKDEYIQWIGPYLYYFNTTLRGERISIWDRLIGNKKQLTLIPKGAKEPKYFQNLIRLNNSFYTNSIKDFYPILQ